jgi:uncharacterized tellurite resistance protein B-like protein
MLKKIGEWFQLQLTDSDTASSEHSVELATAVLFYEIMRADDKFEASERKAYHALIDSHFQLSSTQVTELLELTDNEAKQAVDFVQFTRVINAKCDAKQKRAILDSLWRIAFADGHIDADEEHLIRRVADLLYLSHNQFIQSKLQVVGQ